MLELTLEVNVGTLEAKLLANTTTSTEVKKQDAYYWQPLRSAIISDNFFTVRGQGIRFRGTIEDCNDVFKRIDYKDAVNGAVLTIIVDDMGNYGCYPDCTYKSPFPLLAEAHVILLTKPPLSPHEARMQAAGLVAGSVIVLVGGGVCLYSIFRHVMKKSKRNRDTLNCTDSDFFKEEEECDRTRVYNPMWIPSAVGEPNSGFTSRPNPVLLKKRRPHFRLRLRDAVDKKSRKKNLNNCYSSFSEDDGSNTPKGGKAEDLVEKNVHKRVISSHPIHVHEKQEQEPNDGVIRCRDESAGVNGSFSRSRSFLDSYDVCSSSNNICNQDTPDLENLVNHYDKKRSKMDVELQKLLSNV
eukprot:Gb_27424 [translate_table: standard]